MGCRPKHVSTRTSNGTTSAGISINRFNFTARAPVRWRGSRQERELLIRYKLWGFEDTDAAVCLGRALAR